MKVLYISYVKLKSYGGAVIEANKFIDWLDFHEENDKDFEYKVISLDNDLSHSLNGVILPNVSKKYSVLSRLSGHSHYMYWFWEKNKNKILQYNPDVVLLGRSIFGFMAKDIKKYNPNIKVVTDVDNIEMDYVDAFSGNSTSLKTKQLKSVTKKDESNSINYSDYLVMLTKRNIERTKELYSYNKNNSSVIPICMDYAKNPLCIKSEIKTVVFYGTLSYAPNYQAVIDFLDNVWCPNYALNKDIQFIVAGSKPIDEIKEKISKIDNVHLFPEYKELKDIVPKNSLLIAPLKDGAGMKTKIVEALSLGLIVVASNEAMIGYEAIDSRNNIGIMVANQRDEYVICINQYMKMTENDISEISDKNFKLFEDNYSYKKSRNTMDIIIKELEMG